MLPVWIGSRINCKLKIPCIYKNMKHLTLLTVLLWIVVVSSLREASADESSERLFVRHIQPLLSAKCLACHGLDAKK